MSSGIELLGIVGQNTFTRGQDYARLGHATITEIDAEDRVVYGSCVGSGSRMYETRVQYEISMNNVVQDMDGFCSCPMGFNCKHTVALLLTALPRLTQGSGRLPTPREPDRAHWETVLADSLAPEAPVGGDAGTHKPLALFFELGPSAQANQLTWMVQRGYQVPPGSEALTLRVRPMGRGKRSNWIKTGATWNDVRSGYVSGAALTQLKALDNLHKFSNPADNYYRDPTWLDLGTIDNPAVWTVLQRIAASGVQLIESVGQAAVTLETEPAEAVVDISQVGEAITLHAQVRHPNLRLAENTSADQGDDSLIVLGSPPHTVAWIGRNGLSIARLKQQASTAWSSLRDADKPVHIPARDRPRFETRLLPALLREAWDSADGSFEPPAPIPPTLHLDVHVDRGYERGEPMAQLAWSWHYRDEQGEGYGPLDLHPHPTDPPRDAEAERKVTSAVVGAFEDVDSAVDEEGELRPRSLLIGMEVVTFTADVIDALAAMGVKVTTNDLPRFTDGGSPKVEVALQARDADWFDLEVNMAIGDHQVPIGHVITALSNNQDALFMPDGTYVKLTEPDLLRLRELIAESRELTDARRRSLSVSRRHVSWWEELLALGLVHTSEHAWFTAVRESIENPPDPAPLPAGLKATLRPYQREGFEWLAGLRRSRLGGILADDMGLGKTVQVLAMILDERAERAALAKQAAADSAEAGAPDGPWLVVAPTSVVSNWAAEAAKFAPELKVAVVSSTGARRRQSLAEVAAGADVVVTSYALLRLEVEEYAELGVVGLVLDEAQNAKNHTSKAFASAKKVGSPVTFAVTGTPLENNLGELWAMSALVAPGLLGSPAQFNVAYRKPIERAGKGQGGPRIAREKIALLRKRFAPFLLRRTKDEVATDLPPKQEQVLSVELNAGHRRIYDRHLQRERRRVLRLAEDLEQNRVEVLAALTRLRQLAIDPSLVAGSDGDSEGSGSASAGAASVTGSKLETLLPLLREAADEGHRVLVFSQFTRYLGKIAERLKAEGLGYAYLDGTTKRRAEVIDGFAKGDDPVFLISLKAGGVGLNLTMADYAILADPWWNPAVEAQAVDRAHRIGQQRPVMVYRLVSAGTIEEKVLALQERKRALVTDILSPDSEDGVGAAPAVGSGKLSAADLEELLS